jgi:hypothetical protein
VAAAPQTQATGTSGALSTTVGRKVSVLLGAFAASRHRHRLAAGARRPARLRLTSARQNLQDATMAWTKTLRDTTACVSVWLAYSGALAAPDFDVLASLVDTAGAAAAGTLSVEERFAGTPWQGIEAATMELAERSIGSFAGQPFGWLGSPVTIHYRM